MLDREQPDEINARLARYAATLDARDLWPEVTASAFRAAQTEVARVVAAVLAGGPSPVPLRLPPEADARALGVAASAAGIGPLLGYWCSMGRIAADPPVAGQLATHLEHGRRRAARLRLELEHVLVPLAERGIEVFVLRGELQRPCCVISGSWKGLGLRRGVLIGLPPTPGRSGRSRSRTPITRGLSTSMCRSIGGCSKA